MNTKATISQKLKVAKNREITQNGPSEVTKRRQESFKLSRAMIQPIKHKTPLDAQKHPETPIPTHKVRF